MANQDILSTQAVNVNGAQKHALELDFQAPSSRCKRPKSDASAQANSAVVEQNTAGVTAAGVAQDAAAHRTAQPMAGYLRSPAEVYEAPPSFDFNAQVQEAFAHEGLPLPLPSAPPSSSAKLPLSLQEDGSPCALDSALPSQAPASLPQAPAPPSSGGTAPLTPQQMYQAERRLRKRKAAKGPCGVRLKAARKHAAPAPAGPEFVAEKLPHSRPGWIGSYAEPDKVDGRVYTLQELLDMGFKLVKWNGKDYKVVRTTSGRSMLMLVGRPGEGGGRTWEEVAVGAAEAMDATADEFHLHKPTKRARGGYPVVNIGVGAGRGPQAPYNFADAAPAVGLLGNPDIKRIAHFQSNAFATSAPKLYAHYKDNIDKVFEHNPDLHKNFPGSVFPAAAFNFGPDAVTIAHRDGQNVAYGLCGVTSLGSFDPTKGGHIYFWELGLVVEFPPGSTILVPSACVTHGNTPIQPGERRSSFTQYCAGHMFSYVSHGYRTGTKLKEADPAAKRASDAQGPARWQHGVDLYSNVEELAEDIVKVFGLDTLDS